MLRIMGNRMFFRIGILRIMKIIVTQNNQPTYLEFFFLKKQEMETVKAIPEFLNIPGIISVSKDEQLLNFLNFQCSAPSHSMTILFQVWRKSEDQSRALLWS
jgi:hypothetical protein